MMTRPSFFSRVRQGWSGGTSQKSSENHSPRRLRGYSLVEVTLVLAGIIAATGAVYTLAVRASESQRVKVEVTNLEQLSQSLQGAFAAGIGFGDDVEGLGQELIDLRLIPSRMVHDGEIRNGWKQEVNIFPVQLADMTAPGVAIEYPGLNIAACRALSSQARTGFHDVLINGQSIMRAAPEGTGGIFVPEPGGHIIEAGGENGKEGTSVKDEGSRRFRAERVATLCSTGENGNTLTAATVQFVLAKNNDIGIAQTDLVPCTVPDPSTEYETRSDCRAGYTGQRSYQRTAFCGGPYGNSSWGPWTFVSGVCTPLCTLPSPSTETVTTNKECPTGYAGTIARRRTAVCADVPAGYEWEPWVVIENSCAPLCVTPDPSTETREAACPSGQVGAITQSRTGSCPTQTGAVAWTKWSFVSSTCQDVCVLPDPAVESRETPSCPRNQYGTVREERTATCPGEINGVPVGTPEWSTWTIVSNTCSNSCVVPSPSTEMQSQSCPQGEIGEITLTRSASCPSQGGAPVWSEWTVFDNTCEIECVVPTPSTETRDVACAAGHLGSITEMRTASCFAPTGNPSWSSWTEIENTCAPQCVVPTPATQTREVECEKGYLGAVTQERQATCPAQTGSYTWGAWTTISDTCEQACAVPEPETRETYRDVTCASQSQGQAGIQQQVREETRVATCPAQTGEPVWGEWHESAPWTNTHVNTCYTCPSPQSQWEKQKPAACSAGEIGEEVWEHEQVRTPTCPEAGPPATWSAWIETGERRLVSSTCETACQVPFNPTETRTSTPCPSGQLGQITETREAYCPQPTGPYAWTSWIVTSNTCAPACVLPSPSTQVRDSTQCPRGYLGTITESRSASCPNPTGPYTWSDWVETSNTCELACVVPDPDTETREVACPPGELGAITEMRTAACKEQTGSPSWSPWTQIGSTCAPECTLPTPGYETRTVTSESQCEKDQMGSIVSSRQERRDASCPQATGSYTWGSWYATSAWTVISNTCYTCPTPETQWVSTTGLGCKAGLLGVRTWEKEQQRTAVCETSAWSWGSWIDTGVVREASNTCYTCPSAETQTATESAACVDLDDGYIGGQATRTRTEQRDPTCPVSGPPVTWSAWYATTGWSGWDTTQCEEAPQLEVFAGCKVNASAWESALGGTSCAGDAVDPNTWSFRVGDQIDGRFGTLSFANPGDWEVMWIGAHKSCSNVYASATFAQTCSWSSTVSSISISASVRYVPSGETTTVSFSAGTGAIIGGQ